MKLELPRSDGLSLRQHLEQVMKTTKKRPEELVEPQIPDGGRHIWDAFWELDCARPSGMSLSPISFSEIQAWSGLCGEIIRPWEVRAIRAMDGERLAATSEAMK